jgi:hypothetical protein
MSPRKGRKAGEHVEDSIEELEKAERRACDLSEEIKGLASLCRMIAKLGDPERPNLSEADFTDAMYCVSSTMDRFRETVEGIVGVMAVAPLRNEHLNKSTKRS